MFVTRGKSAGQSLYGSQNNLRLAAWQPIFRKNIVVDSNSSITP
jgi:hypothetical protein